ncbi:MAG: type I-F CRISPR-associated protein Csy3 [Thermodesulfobacteriota bacterium]|nr:type I-F CRISPR-associated protein Csy3 [Thermodesulfobacteriota bacterium]
MSIKLPSVLAFERKLETSDALMYAGNWGEGPVRNDDWKTIPITTRKNRGTKSSYEHRNKPDELNEANLAEGDDANLPHDKDTLKVSFSLRIIGNVGKPFACNDPDFAKPISQQVKVYKDAEEGGLQTLADRYAYNIANGRFLWRNRVCAEEIFIHAKTEDVSEGLSFNAYDFSLNDFDENADHADLQRLAEIIYKGLKAGDSSFTFIEVDAYVKLGNGQHVFPSQEMNMGDKKKILFQLNKCAAIHNVKIGNAIRTIDNWYKKADFPIAVEPYGSVTQMGQAFRKSKDDLYTLMLDWLNEKKNVSDEDKHFVVANFIRGGVFGGKGD